MRRRLHALVWVGLLSGVFAASCLARRDKPFVRQTEDDAGPPDATSLEDGGPPDVSPDALDLEPHAVLGVDPPHGAFVGDTRVMLRGNGFDSSARVWFGDVEATNVTPVDPQRIQVVTPPGIAGAVDVTVQNGDAKSTRAILTGGYTYDPFFADPASGPTSGGTVITIEGDRTSWDENVVVEIDRKPCANLGVLSKTRLACTTPPNEAGAKVLSVITDGTREDVLDGFTYGNSDNGFKGGLSGQPLKNTKQLTVVAFDNFEGRAIPGVSVLLGTDVETGRVGRTDKNGAVSFSDDLGEAQTVTVALKCFQPITFYDVRVDHVTAYLDPVLSPACGKLNGELPAGGGTPGVGSSVAGEVVWPLDKELKRQGWSNVPQPASDAEKEVAYVFRLSSEADRPFRLPSTSDAITRDSLGGVGYKFYQSTSPGNFTLYALAGLEDSSGGGRKFRAYAMGILRGVAVRAGKSADDVYVQIDVPLDHELTLTLDPPTPGPRGPDRIVASVAVQVQDQGFALLPSGYVQRSLPSTGEFSFVGVPPLVGSLAGSKYVLGARAVTGSNGLPPLSVIGSASATSSAAPLDLGGFVPLPVLTHPPAGVSWDMKSLELQPASDGQEVSLTIVRVLGGQKSTPGDWLYQWTLVAPGPGVPGLLALPDLEKLAPGSGLPVGALGIETTLAHIEDFVYGSLRYRQLGRSGWNAYATDTHYTQR